ncbi:MAG: tetratricopeptide repeat protein [Bacteroidetes bacterium]|nr:MAG: tetratricopeptide repeat protein [Bacteroidota bacterium]TAG85336.1 MAG: tetratricopeptide repeat protein [Bacteroidota bacterium]
MKNKFYFICFLSLYFLLNTSKAQSSGVEFAKIAEEKEKAEDWEAALYNYSRAVGYETKNINYILKKGLMLLKTGSPRKAITEFKIVEKLDKTNGEALYLKAAALDSLRNFEVSRREYVKAIRLLGNKNVELYTSRGNSFILQKDYNNAVSNLNVAIQIDRKNAIAYYLRGIAKFHLVDSNGACNDWKLARDLGSKQADIFYKKNCQE